MLSLSEDLRESDDSLDTILKRHKTNLYNELREITPGVIENKSVTCSYETFKEYYLNHLELSADKIMEALNLTRYKYRLLTSKVMRETGHKRTGAGEYGRKLIIIDKEKQYQEFKKLYLEGVKYNEIQKIVGVSGVTMVGYRQRVYSETGYRRKRSKNDG